MRILEEAGHPVVRIVVQDRYALGQEFFRWEIATAIVGAVLDLNPFDQPDVEAQKIKTRALTDAYVSRPGPGRRMRRSSRPTACSCSPTRPTPRPLTRSPARAARRGIWLAAQIVRARPGDYIALLAYLDQTPGA